MLEIKYLTQFKKDLKKVTKRGNDLAKLKKLIEILAKEKDIPVKYKDHKLSGNYLGYRDCRIEPDWLLIYRKSSIHITLARTGSHSDLFR